MLRIIDDCRKQLAVCWPTVGLDANGNPTYGAPVEILTRFVYSTEVYTRANGEEKTSRGVVLCPQLPDGSEVKEQDVLWEGELADVPGPALTDPFKLPKAWAVDRFDKVPTLDATQFLRIAYL